MLSDLQILEAIQEEKIVINPFFEKYLNTNSYDVRLGEWVCRQKKEIRVIEYNSNDGRDFMWEEPKRIGNELMIRANETLLCHTEEFIGGRGSIATEMRAKSTTGRYGLSVCKCAGLGDVGFTSRWTMEMTNHSRFPILIKVGEPIAQILFHYTGLVRKEYQGRYGQGIWSPMDMLPKRHRV